MAKQKVNLWLDLDVVDVLDKAAKLADLTRDQVINALLAIKVVLDPAPTKKKSRKTKK